MKGKNILPGTKKAINGTRNRPAIVVYNSAFLVFMFASIANHEPARQPTAGKNIYFLIRYFKWKLPKKQ